MIFVKQDVDVELFELVYIQRMYLNTILTTIHFHPPAQFPTEKHTMEMWKKLNRKTNQVFVEQMEEPPTQKLSEQILLDDCSRLKPIEIVFVFIGRYRIVL